jgi:hypothetical protein
MVLDGTGPLPDRVKAARAVVEDEQRREEASLGFRVRLMLAIVTSLAALLAVGILGLARRTRGLDASDRIMPADRDHP